MSDFGKVRVMSPQFGNCISIKYISVISELSNENKNQFNEKRKKEK